MKRLIGILALLSASCTAQLSVGAGGQVTLAVGTLNASTTVNGQECTLGSTCTVHDATVGNLMGVPFCTGYTPVNGQLVQYTTVSSPNPCYTAATISGGGGGSGVVNSGLSGQFAVYPSSGTTVGGHTLSSGDVTGALGFTPENAANKSTSASLGTSDTAYPSQNAVKSYVDSGLAGKQAAGSYLAAAGNGLVSTAAATTNAWNSNAPPPTSQYVMPTLSGVYTPLLTTSGCTSSSGLSNAAGGLVATTGGVAGNCNITLPQILPQNGFWRVAVLVQINDTNVMSVQLTDAASDWWAGFNLSHIATDFISGGWGPTASPYNQYGQTGGIPAGTYAWITANSDGSYVEQTLWPAQPSVAGFAGSAPAFQAAYTGLVYNVEQPTSYIYSGNAVFGALQKIVLQNASSTSTIVGVYASIGRLDAPTDGQLQPPIFVQPRILDDATSSGYTAQVAVPGSYGSPKGTPICVYHHPNGNPGQLGYAGAQSSLAALFADGYMLTTLTGDATGNYSGPTSSNWGAPAGMKYRKHLVDWIRAYLPASTQLYHYGLSMGGLDALEYEKTWPGSAAIASISGAVDLTGAFNDGTGYAAGFTTIIRDAYGAWYRALQSGTNHAPASSPTYWERINDGFAAPATGYYSSTFANKGAWASGTAYTLNQTAEVPYAGAVGSLSPYDPNLNYGAFTKAPVVMWHGTTDTTIPPAVMTAFANGVNSAGGSVTTHLVTGQGHLGSGLFDPTALTTFFDTYRTSAVSTNGANYTPPIPQANGTNLPLGGVNAAPGTCGDSTHVCQVVTNSAGQVTSQTAVAVTAPATFPTRVTTVKLLNGTALVGNTTLFTNSTGADAQYIVRSYLVLKTQGTAGWINIGGVYNNGYTSGATFGTNTIATTAAVGTVAQDTHTVVVASGQTATYNVTFTSVTGSPAFDAWIEVEQLQ